jgi:hypothetical protein
MALILIARHGKTLHEHLLVDEYKLKIKNFIDLLQNIIIKNEINEIQFNTSDTERTIDSSTILLKTILKKNNDIKYSFKKNSKIVRWNKKSIQTHKERKDLAYSYGKLIYKKVKNTKKTLFVYMTHSSIINSLVNGILNISDKTIKLIDGSFNLLEVKKDKTDIIYRNI